MGNRSSDTMSIVRDIAVLQIRPNCIIEYLEPVNGYSGWLHKPHIEEANKAREFNGELKEGAIKRLKKAINLLIMSSPRFWMYNPVTQKNQVFQLNFITLTVSSKYQLLTAEEAYITLLKPFLDWLRRTKDCGSYIWKAELQQRGQIHYHLTTGTFLLYNEIRDKWNYLQKQAGLLEDFFSEHNHYDPNSTDVHTVLNIKDICSYLCKYLAKEQEADSVMKADCAKDQDIRPDEAWGAIMSCYPVNTIPTVRTRGKIWDCSQNLKKGKYYSLIEEPVHQFVLKEAAEAGISKMITGDRYRIHLMRDQNPLDILSKSELEQLKSQMKAIRERSESDES